MYGFRGKPVTIITQLNADNAAVEVLYEKGKEGPHVALRGSGDGAIYAMKITSVGLYQSNDTGKHVHSICYTKGRTPKMPSGGL